MPTERCPNPTCGTSLQIPAEAAGKKVVCPACKQRFVVPASVAVPVPIFPCPHCLAPVTRLPENLLRQVQCPKCKGNYLQMPAALPETNPGKDASAENVPVKDATSAIIMVRAMCSVTGDAFSIRFTRVKPGEWHATGVYKRTAGHVQNKYPPEMLDGEIYFDADFPGCPFCDNKVLFECSCGMQNCEGSVITLDNGQRMSLCANCRTWGFLGRTPGTMVGAAEA